LASTVGSLVLVGRNAVRLSAVAASIDDRIATLVVRSPEEAAVEIKRNHPAVVVNTIGPFCRTAVPIARACPPAGHYVDVVLDVGAVSALLAMREEAVTAGSTLMTGAGFAVLATEALVGELCRGRQNATIVRVDSLPSVEIKAGVVGEALAASIVEGLFTGGRRYEGGSLVRARLGGNPRSITVTDGEVVRVGDVAHADLHAAWISSGALSASATSSDAPTGRAVQAVLPLARAMVSIPPLRRFAIRRLAAVH